MREFLQLLFNDFCLYLCWTSSAFALYICLFSLETALQLCFLSYTFHFARLKQGTDYLLALAYLLHVAVCGFFGREIVSSLLKRVREEGHDIYANWLEGYEAVMIVLTALLHLINKRASIGEILSDTDIFFSLVASMCLCTLEAGPAFGSAIGLILNMAKKEILETIEKKSGSFYFYWGRRLCGIFLIGTVYYSLYAHYMGFVLYFSFMSLVQFLTTTKGLMSSLWNDNSLNNQLKHRDMTNNRIIKTQLINIFLYTGYYHSLPTFLQPTALNWSLRQLRNMKGSQVRLVQVFVRVLGKSQTLAGLTRANLHFLQNSLLSHPDFRLLVLLYRHHLFSFLQWGESRIPFLVRLRTIQALPGSKSAKEFALMRELLERAEAKLMLLWLLGKEIVGPLGRVPKYLLQDMVEYF